MLSRTTALCLFTLMASCSSDYADKRHESSQDNASLLGDQSAYETMTPPGASPEMAPPNGSPTMAPPSGSPMPTPDKNTAYASSTFNCSIGTCLQAGGVPGRFLNTLYCDFPTLTSFYKAKNAAIFGPGSSDSSPEELLNLATANAAAGNKACMAKSWGAAPDTVEYVAQRSPFEMADDKKTLLGRCDFSCKYKKVAIEDTYPTPATQTPILDLENGALAEKFAECRTLAKDGKAGGWEEPTVLYEIADCKPDNGLKCIQVRCLVHAFPGRQSTDKTPQEIADACTKIDSTVFGSDQCDLFGPKRAGQLPLPKGTEIKGAPAK